MSDDDKRNRKPAAGDDASLDDPAVCEAELTLSRELVTRAQDGDLDSYNRLFERYYQRVLHIVRIRLGKHIKSFVEAEDILQETFIAAIKTFDRFEMRHESSLISWLARLAENKIREAVDYHHAKKRDRRRERALVYVRGAMASGSLHFDLPASIDLPIDQVSDKELIKIMGECLAEMSADHREVILLRLYHKGSWAWVAEQMGKPTDGAARELFRRAKLSLIKRMSERTDLE
jgi:RNA polymerase sigma-70 factor (ECF subfamily)